MAISKLKPRKISDGKSIRQYLADRIDYGKNPDKTDGDDWFPPTSVLPKLPRRNL